MPSRETKVLVLLYIVLTISILIGQEPHAYFENSRDSVDKHNYSIICYPIFYHNINVKENVFFSERELKKALRDTLTRAAW